MKLTPPPRSRTYRHRCEALPFTLERHAEQLEQAPAFLVRPGGGDDRDFEAARFVNLVVIDLGEDELFAQAKGEVAPPVERTARYAAEVTRARQCGVHQSIEELPHALAAERDHHPDV